VSEPLMTCRKTPDDVETGVNLASGSKGWGGPADCPTDVRHEGGVTLRQASIRNTGTCCSDAKGETQAVNHARVRVPMRSAGAETPVLGKKVL
jgi:hypothetical protein